jgi:hypothetical protein
MPRHLRIEYPGAIYHPPSFNFGTTSVINHMAGASRFFRDEFSRVCSMTGRLAFVLAFRRSFK